MSRRDRVRNVTAACAAVILLALTGCSSGDPAADPPTSTSAPLITAPSSTPDPTEEAEDAVQDAVQLYVETLMAAGLSEDWSEETLAQGMRGDALANWVDFGPLTPGSYEGEIVVSDIQIQELTLDPISAEVQLCYDTTGWLTQGQPGRIGLAQARITEDGGTAYVSQFTGQDAPCA